ncbi:unnamed protein product [Urochloa humidicola]
MAPPRRAAGSLSPPPPHTAKTKGWLSRCRRPPKNRSGGGGGVDPLAGMPDDLLYDSILSRVLSDDAAVARCAAVCRRWGTVLAAREAAIRRAMPPPGRFLPHLALGFFHGGGHDDGSHRRRRLLAPAAQQPDPRFVPTASASAALLGGSPSFPRLMPEGGGAAGLFHYARPVASRGGRVVLELQNKARSDGVALAVCNPMTGDVALVPPLAGGDFPGHDYACAVLTADDLDAPPGGSPPSSLFSFSFGLVLVYNRRGFTALRCYTSGDGGGWGPEARKPGAQISGHVLRGLGPAVVLRGVAYWPMMDAAALAARVGLAGGVVGHVRVLPYRLATSIPDWYLLGATPDGRLSYVSAAVVGDELGFLVEALEEGGVWEKRDRIVLTQFAMSTTTELKLRWLGEKSGTLLFTVGRGGGGGNSGAFALNLGTRSVEKLADGVLCNSWRNMFGYEMDPTALLASITARFNSSHDKSTAG